MGLSHKLSAAIDEIERLLAGRNEPHIEKPLRIMQALLVVSESGGPLSKPEIARRFPGLHAAEIRLRDALAAIDITEVEAARLAVACAVGQSNDELGNPERN